jgi:hypothetical protein
VKKLKFTLQILHCSCNNSLVINGFVTVKSGQLGGAIEIIEQRKSHRPADAGQQLDWTMINVL